MLRPAVVVLLCLTAAGCSGAASTDSTPEEPSQRLLVVGDSIVDGYYASAPGRGFTSLLGDRLDAEAEAVGVAGARAFRVAAAVEDADLGPADVVVLEVGANDVGKSTLAEWTDGYRRLLAAAAATAPDAQVVCLGPWNAPGPSRRYEAVVRRLCADDTYLPLSDLYDDRRLRGPAGVATDLGPSDDFHPNDRGHAAIAERVVGALADQ